MDKRPNTLHQETPNRSSSKLPQKAQNSQKRSRDRAAIGTTSQEYCSGISWILKNYAPPWMKTSSLLRSLLRTAVGVLTPRCRDTRRPQSTVATCRQGFVFSSASCVRLSAAAPPAWYCSQLQPNIKYRLIGSTCFLKSLTASSPIGPIWGFPSPVEGSPIHATSNERKILT